MASLYLLAAVSLCLVLCFTSPSNAVPTHRHSRLSSLPTTAAPPTRQPLARSTGPLLPSSSPLHPSKGTLANVRLEPAIDCAFRSVAIEVIAARQPSDAFSNWTALAESALQMEQCSNYSLPAAVHSPHSVARAPQSAACVLELFVDAERGDDSSSGSMSSPLRSVTAALTALRLQRQADARLSSSTACITLRGGRHYLGSVSSASQPVTSSRIGALHLTAEDSNLMLQGSEGEEVVVSGGVELAALNWTVWKSTAAGDIMQATLPPSLTIDDDMFNELYTDGLSAVRAKYPNGNPYTHGQYSSPSGFIDSADSWLPSTPFPAASHVHVDRPYRNGTFFQTYDLGVAGGASVFDPPSNFWSVESPLGGDMYRVPGGLVGGMELEGRLGNWTNVDRGLVHAFHGGYWGSWVFQMAAVNSTTNNTITFERGGFQEARGNGNGGSYYVSNLLEELDAENEWYYDPTSTTLYFLPNKTTGFPQSFVASQRACLISITGSVSEPAANITIRNMVVTETSNTFMSMYEAPASGDWAIHRGGAVFIEGAENITIAQSLFTQVATNALVLSNWNRNVTVTHNEFVWLGDSGIIIVGSTSGLDGVTNTNQPDLITVSHNLLHETGAYVKQSAPTFVALSRRVEFSHNVLFNVPRSGININDGFAGNKTIAWNVMFNTVRETSDHGPINTWDRQPYLTEQRAGKGHPSLVQHESFIHHNALFNSYNSFYPIDHDDGSCYWTDTYNVQFYGAKKNYLGHSKTDEHELYIYPDTKDAQGVGVCIADQAPQPGSSGWGEVWTNNRCLLYSSPVVYNIWYCDVDNLFTPLLANNTIYAPVGAGLNATFVCGRNGSDVELSLEEWQAYGEDLGTKVLPAPEVSEIAQWIRDMLIV